MRRVTFVVFFTVSFAQFADFDQAEFEFSYGFRDPALFGRMSKVEKVLNDPALKPDDFSRALTYLCEDLSRNVHKYDFNKKQKQCLTIADQLIKKGASVNAENGHHTALRASILNGLDAYFKYLLEKGADVNLRDGRGQTALMLTGHDGSLWFAKELLKAGAKVNAQSKSGRTALHEAAFCGNAELAALLIKHKAPLNVKDEEGLTPLQLAEVWGKSNVMAVLKSAGAKATPLPAKYAAARDKLAENKKKVDARDEAERIQQGKRENAEANKRLGKELAYLQRRLDAKAAEIQKVEAQMSAIGWSGSAFYSKTVTGYKCDNNNQNCRATYQGGR